MSFAGKVPATSVLGYCCWFLLAQVMAVVFLAVSPRHSSRAKERGRGTRRGEATEWPYHAVIRNGRISWLVRVIGVRCGSITFAG